MRGRTAVNDSDLFNPSPARARTIASLSCAVSLSRKGRGSQHSHHVALNFITLIASKFCTPPPTRLVV